MTLKYHFFLTTSKHIQARSRVTLTSTSTTPESTSYCFPCLAHLNWPAGQAFKLVLKQPSFAQTLQHMLCKGYVNIPRLLQFLTIISGFKIASLYQNTHYFLLIQLRPHISGQQQTFLLYCLWMKLQNFKTGLRKITVENWKTHRNLKPFNRSQGFKYM